MSVGLKREAGGASGAQSHQALREAWRKPRAVTQSAPLCLVGNSGLTGIKLRV